MAISRGLFVIGFFFFLCASVPAQAPCDLSIQSDMTFADFETAVDAMADLDGDGILRVCLGSGVRITHDSNSTHGDIWIERDNVHLTGLDRERPPVFENFRTDNSSYTGVLYGNSVSGLRFENLKLIDHGKSGFGVSLFNSEMDLLRDVNIRTMGERSDGVFVSGPAAAIRGAIERVERVSILNEGDRSYGIFLLGGEIGSILDTDITGIGDWYMSGIGMTFGSIGRISGCSIRVTGFGCYGIGVNENVGNPGTCGEISDVSIDANGGYPAGIFVLGPGSFIKSITDVSLTMNGRSASGITVGLSGDGSVIRKVERVKILDLGSQDYTTGIDVRDGNFLYKVNEFVIQKQAGLVSDGILVDGTIHKVSNGAIIGPYANCINIGPTGVIRSIKNVTCHP